MRGDFSKHRSGLTPAGRELLIVVVVTSGTCLSLFFACVTPFAALAAVAALKLGRRDALSIVGVVWLANQAIGYGVLGYPWTWDSAAWGGAIGLSACLATLVAIALATSRPAPLAISLPFVSAFATFELTLYAAGLVLPESAEAFSAKVVGQVFLTNAIALMILFALNRLAIMAGLPTEKDISEPRALEASATR